MANCRNCSAPLPPNSIVCSYCNSRNDTDLKGIHKYTVQEPESERICPRCDIPLATINLNKKGVFLIERCEECMGLFFDPGELEALIKTTVDNVYHIDYKKLSHLNTELRHEDYPTAYIKCPVCRTIMNPVNFGARSGVIIDRCHDHGIWLDGGELRHLLEWVKAGGELLAEKRKAMRNKMDEQEARQKRKTTPSNSTSIGNMGYSDFDSYGKTLRNDDPLIFDIIKGVARWFLS